MFLGEVRECLAWWYRLAGSGCARRSYGIHVGDDLWTAIVHQIGDPAPHVQVVAALPAQVIAQSSISATLANGGNLTAAQATHVGLLWRTARKLVHLWDYRRLSLGNWSSGIWQTCQ